MCRVYIHQYTVQWLKRHRPCAYQLTGCLFALMPAKPAHRHLLKCTISWRRRISTTSLVSRAGSFPSILTRNGISVCLAGWLPTPPTRQPRAAYEKKNSYEIVTVYTFNQAIARILPAVQRINVHTYPWQVERA